MLELQAITAGYGHAPVLREVSLWVPPGSVVALLGPNGAGKTTLLRVASGLLQPTSGQVRLDGHDVTERTTDALAQHGVCHIPEGRGIFPTLTVRDNLAVYASGRDVDGAVDRAVEAFPILGEKLHQPAQALSGGQQQMLALARIYVTEPSYVLLDEVSIGLAPVIVDEIFEFLRTVADRGCALLLVEQYVSRALALAEYVYLMNRGAVEFAGEPGELDVAHLTDHYLGTS